MDSENASSAGNQQERVPKNKDSLKYYLAGFADSEGSFNVNVCKNKYSYFGWKLDPLFQIYQSKENDKMLHIFRDVLGCGYIRKSENDSSGYVYCVNSINNLVSNVIPFFEEHPLIGSKYKDFSLFKEIVYALANKEQLNFNGFSRLTRLACKMSKCGKNKKYLLGYVLRSLDQSSETKRQTHIR